MKTRLLIFSLLIIPVIGYPSEIAAVNFNAIKQDLREFYFSKPGNAELKEQFEAAVREEERFHEEIQRRIMEGESPIDFQESISMSRGPERYQLERRIDADLKKELYIIVSGMDLAYDLIYDASDTETIIYAKRPVDDLTTIVKQAIIDLGRENSPEHNKPEGGNGD